MPPYEYLLTERAFYALETCSDQEAKQIVLAIEQLMHEPGRKARFYSRDHKSRMVPWLAVEAFFIGYFVDHASKRVEIVDILQLKR